jgi:ABC-type multidrug transport system fused ATPase/permease subunit
MFAFHRLDRCAVSTVVTLYLFCIWYLFPHRTELSSLAIPWCLKGSFYTRSRFSCEIGCNVHNILLVPNTIDNIVTLIGETFYQQSCSQLYWLLIIIITVYVIILSCSWYLAVRVLVLAPLNLFVSFDKTVLIVYGPHTHLVKLRGK